MQILIYLISFLEWFTTLSIQIIAIRNFTPIIGTNSISTSVIIWVMLLALSYWYYIWWKISRNKSKQQIWFRVSLNMIIAWLYYLLLTFVIDQMLLTSLIEATGSYFFSILLSSFILFFVPIFFASQTIPLLSELLKWENTWEKIWKLLFYSTIGSFIGSIWTSTILFSYLWVEKSAVLNTTILSFLAVLILISTHKKIPKLTIIPGIIFVLSTSILFFEPQNNVFSLYKHSNTYHNIEIIDNMRWQRVFLQNWWYASGLNTENNESFFKYIIEIREQIITNRDENILIIGWAGFTLPNELSKQDFTKKIDVVDVDSSLKDISEEYFLQEKLNSKVNFEAVPSRYFINQAIKNNEKYDSLIIDIYVWKSLAPQTLTDEFFDNLTQISEDIYINLITDVNLESDFSKRILNTMKNNFWEVYYQNVNQEWTYELTNFVVTNKNLEWYTKYKKDNDFWIYTDDKNSIEMDLFEIIAY